MRKVLLFFALILISVQAIFAEASFEVIPPRNVIAGNSFTITFRLKDGEGSGIKVPSIKGCKLLYGPATSTRQSYQVINGQASANTTVDYTYTYRAEEAGTYTIDAASIVVNGKTLTTKSASFTVLPPDKAAQQDPNGRVRVDDYSTQTPDKQITSDDVFIRIILSKSRAYEQEAIECTIKLYTKCTITAFYANTQPYFDGFLVDEVNLQPSLNQVEHYNGQNYETAILKKCIIFPQKSGKLTINSGKYEITVAQYERVDMGFFSAQRPVEKKINVNSNSISIMIDPLPQPQPDGFTGAVGTFSIDSKLTPNSFRTNEAASLIYTITGTGNIKYIKEPSIDFPSEFEQYTPKTDINASVSGNNVTGKSTIEYTFVPQSVGKFTIGADKFVYFDPDKRQYITLETPKYDLDVAKGVSTPTVVDTDQQNIKAKNTDILHIKLGDKKLTKNIRFILFSPWYWCFYLIALILLVAIIAIYNKQVKLNADIKGRRLQKANKVARQRLKLAHRFMTAHENDKFYEEMLHAIWGYLSDKLGIPASQLLRENISSELSQYGAPDHLIDKIIELLNECEMARYSPAKSDEQISNLYNMTSQTINELEGIKRIKR